MKVVVLAGGTGGAKLALGFQGVLAPGDLTVITNTGDDLEVHGLLISPDTDSVLYRLAGLFNPDTGWGVVRETFASQSMLERYGAESWFNLGDQDLATHILRTLLIKEGLTLSQATNELRLRLQVPSGIIPMSDDPVRTHFQTDRGRLTLQEYFVRHHCQPRVESISFDHLELARPSEPALAALTAADVIVIGPSNPLISIAPIMAVLGTSVPAERTVAVSPIVGGRALKGPTIQMMGDVGLQPTVHEVASTYTGQARRFVLDQTDSGLKGKIETLGYDVLVTDTVMGETSTGAERLAGDILEFVGAVERR